MKIVTWNCCGKFREDLPSILDDKSDYYIEADIYVIQECENPDEDLPKYKKYKELVEKTFGCKYKWIGDIHYKGLGIFVANDDITVECVKVSENKFKHFLPLKINDNFTLLGVWAMGKDDEKGLKPYVEMIHDYFDANEDLFNEDLVMCGDFNSSEVFNGHHPKAKNHTELNNKLESKNLFSVYHSKTKEDHGKETKYTFYQARHLSNPYHLDYVYAKKGAVKKFKILDHGKWICLSDHLPITFEIDESKFD